MYVDNDDGTTSITHEWCNAGVGPHMEDMQNVRYEEYPWWKQKMDNFENIYISSVRGIAAFAYNEMSLLLSMDIQATLVVPVRLNGTRLGFLGFTSLTEREWGEDVINMLVILSRLIGTVVR